MQTFETPNFRLLPDPAALASAIEAGGIGAVAGMELFSYSSCTPAIQVTLRDGTRRRAVVRGEQQNDLEWSPRSAITLEKEIQTLKQLRASGLNVPEILSGDTPLSVPGQDALTGRRRNFRFYVMGFMPGIAVDRKVRDSGQKDRAYYLSRIAGFYARLHRTTGPGFGITDATGRPAKRATAKTFGAFLPASFDEKCALVSAHADPAIGAAVQRWSAGRIPRVLDMLEKSTYEATPRLVLYDGSAGNMLVSGKRIGVIDIALTGYFDATTEFCSFFHAMRDVLLQDYRGRSYWDFFAARYREAGGTLPPDGLLWALILLGQMNLQLHNLVYNATHNNPARRNRVGEMAGAIKKLMAIDKATPKRLAAALS